MPNNFRDTLRPLVRQNRPGRSRATEVFTWAQPTHASIEYIAKAADFAKPILTHLRKVVHAACPGVEETMKWSAPHFDYKGEMMCGMAAFKAHCAFGFWKSSLVLDGPSATDAMGQFGRITSIRDLPPDRTITAYVKKAAKLNDDGHQGREKAGGGRRHRCACRRTSRRP